MPRHKSAEAHKMVSDALTEELEQVTREQRERVDRVDARATARVLASSLPTVVSSVLLLLCYAFARTREENNEAFAGDDAAGAAYADWHAPVHYLIEALLLLVLTVVNVCVTLRDVRMRRTSLLRRAQAQIDAYKRRGCTDSVVLTNVPGELSVQRHDKPTMALPNKLVRNDQVLVPLGVAVPDGAIPVLSGGASAASAAAAAAETATEATEATAAQGSRSASQPRSSFSTAARSNNDSWLGQYQITEAPGCKQLRDAFAYREQMPRTMMERYSRTVLHYYGLAVWVCFALSLLASLLCYYLAPAPNQEFVTSVLAQPAYVLATPVLLSLQAIVWAVVESFGNARLLALFKVLQEADREEQKLPLEKREEALAQRRKEQKKRFGRVDVPFALVRHYFASLLFDRSDAVMRCSNMFQTLGAVTACVFLDKDATLIEPVPQPERLYMPDGEVGTTLSLSTHVADDSSVTLSFDEQNWRDHIAVLKPIGLTTLLQRPLCRRDPAPQTAPHILNQTSLPPAPATAVRAAEEAEARAEAEGPCTARGIEAAKVGERWKDAFVKLTTSFSRQYNRCLCLLTREIGFSEQAIDSFERIKEIHTYASLHETLAANCGAANTPFAAILAREPLYMCSLVIRDVKSDSYQMLSKGNAPTVLGHCESLWDGTEVREMTPAIRASIIEHYTKLSDAYTVVAFAYKPIPKRHQWLFMRVGRDIRLTRVDAQSPGARPCTSSAERNLVRKVMSRRSMHVNRPLVIAGDKSPAPAAEEGGDAAKDASKRSRKKKDRMKSPLREGKSYSGKKGHGKCKVAPELAATAPAATAAATAPTSSEAEGKEGDGEPADLSSSSSEEEVSSSSSLTTALSTTTTTTATTESKHVVRSQLAESTTITDGEEDDDEDEEEEEAGKSGDSKEVELRRRNKKHHQKKSKKHCQHRHNGQEEHPPITTTTTTKEKEQEQEGEDEETPVHRPVTTKHDARESPFEEIQTGQILLGMAALRDIPRSGTDTVIEALLTAGVHFMYFSSEDVKRSTFFAAKLGLETDWNCVISLKDAVPPQEPYMDGPAKLPRGISRIREHIENVDTVPLRVPVFCDCTPESSAEMIRILQENGDVVLCVGSAVEVRNTPAFAQANIAMSMQPEPDHCMLEDHVSAPENQLLSSCEFPDSPSTGNISADLTSLPCSFIMHQKTSFSTLSTLLCEGRHVLRNATQAGLCLLCLVAALHVSIFAGSVVFALPLFSGYQLLWLAVLLVPLLSLSLLTGTVNNNVMTQLNAKCEPNPALVGRSVCLLLSQAIPIALFVIAQHFVTLGGMLGDWSFPIVFLNTVASTATSSSTSSSSASAAVVSSVIESVSSTAERTTAPVALVYAQNITMLTFVLGALVAAAVLSHPSVALNELLGMIKYNKGRSIAVACAAVLQLVFCAISLGAADSFAALSLVPWWSLVVLLAVAPVCLVTGIIALSRYHAWWQSYQLELKLIFDTKLGMYSPVATRNSNALANGGGF